MSTVCVRGGAPYREVTFVDAGLLRASTLKTPCMCTAQAGQSLTKRRW
jgi:hypothetical protein